MLTNLSLIGTYTMSVTGTSTTSLTETGSALGMIDRNYRVITDQTVTQNAAEEALTQDQTVHSQTTLTEEHGAINMATGDLLHYGDVANDEHGARPGRDGSVTLRHPDRNGNGQLDTRQDRQGPPGNYELRRLLPPP